MLKLINMFYERNNLDLKRGTFRARGDILEIMPVNEHGKCIRIDYFDDEIESIYDVVNDISIPVKNPPTELDLCKLLGIESIDMLPFVE